MEPWETETPDDMVDAIEEGKIVKVTEDYATREGLPILKKAKEKIFPPARKLKKDEDNFFEDLTKLPNHKKSQVTSELIENFNWRITNRRRSLGISRKQLADSINESESTLKFIENGLLKKDDFIIINKIQNQLNINLRSDKKDFSESPRSLLNEEKDTPKSQEKNSMSGADIEITEDE